MRRPAYALAALSMAMVLCSCTTASPDPATYDEQVMLTAGVAVSEVRTVERLLSLLQDERIMRPVAVAQVRHSAALLDSTAKGLSDLDPPPARDPLADRVGSLLDAAQSQVGAARIAIARAAADDYPALGRALERTARAFEAVEAGEARAS